jgi:hypothetical protein
MPLNSQPLDPEIYGKFEEKDLDKLSERKIISQRIGKMFDENEKIKIGLKTRLNWIWRDIKGAFYDTKYAIRNHFKWRKTIKNLRPWEGFGGIINIMQTHLKDYIETEEKYGHSEKEYKNKKIATAKETVEILERMKDPIEYSSKLRDEVESRYPKYQYLITEYETSTSYSGDFVADNDFDRLGQLLKENFYTWWD